MFHKFHNPLIESAIHTRTLHYQIAHKKAKAKKKQASDILNRTDELCKTLIIAPDFSYILIINIQGAKHMFAAVFAMLHLAIVCITSNLPKFIEFFHSIILAFENISPQVNNTVSSSLPTNATSSFIDWSSFVPDILATGLGFILALWGERKYDKHKENIERENLITSLCKEFDMLIQSLDSIAHVPTARWIKPLKTPVWDSAISSNKISLIDSYEWFKTVCTLYDDIKDYNEWHAIRTNLRYSNSSLPSTDQDVYTNEIDQTLANGKREILHLISIIKQDISIHNNNTCTAADK